MAVAVHPLTGELCYCGTALSALECLLRHELVKKLFASLLAHGLHKHPPKLSAVEMKQLAVRVLTGTLKIFPVLLAVLMHCRNISSRYRLEETWNNSSNMLPMVRQAIAAQVAAARSQ